MQCYEKFKTVARHIFNKLFSIGEDDFRVRRMYYLCKLLERYMILKESFNHSDFIYVPQTHNAKTYILAYSAMKKPSFIVNMDTELQIWFAKFN